MKLVQQKNIWIKRSLIFLAFIIVPSLAINIYLIAKDYKLSAQKEKLPEPDNTCSLSIVRETNSKEGLIKPLLLAEVNTESPRFALLKAEINKFIDQRKKKGDVQSISVYLRDLNSTSWTDIGDNTGYYPGSLMKVPIMIYFLKQEQNFPGTLKKEYFYAKPTGQFPVQTFLGDSILPGRSYSIAKLLWYMITQSDNNATVLLSSHIDFGIYQQIFKDLDIPCDDLASSQYMITPRQYSKFFRILYSSTYLSKDLSSYALKLLTECNFRSGLVKDLPAGLIVAHKFGERGVIGHAMDFSESGIIYSNSQPYLIVIMTRGNDVRQLSTVVRELSIEIFNQYKDI